MQSVLKYMYFSESMRKYVVMYTMQRLCTKDTSLDIDGKLVDIKKGTPVILVLCYFS